jgi:hypothetical protein
MFVALVVRGADLQQELWAKQMSKDEIAQVVGDNLSFLSKK